MNASCFTGPMRFDVAVELPAAPAPLIFPARMFPPGPLLLNAARGRAGLAVVVCVFEGELFFTHWPRGGRGCVAACASI